jgi:hypothetical protein
MSAHVRLSTRLRNQTELTNTTEAEGEKDAWLDGLAAFVVPLVLGFASCWDICVRRDWVVFCCKFG